MRESLFHPLDSLCSPWEESVSLSTLEDNKSSDKLADFSANNSPSTCVYAAILNWLRPVSNGHTRFCLFENTRLFEKMPLNAMTLIMSCIWC